jgi:ABC-type Fe3+-siderophore transport system permease subunit
MKTRSILIIIAGVIITIFCLIYFRPALNVVDSDPMTATPSGAKTSEWPIFLGLLTTFVGITFYIVATNDRTAKKK